MNEEKKVYPVSGMVTICTDEYRDLVLGTAEAKIESERQQDKWYEQYTKANKLEAELKQANEKLKQYDAFFSSKAEYKMAYKMFCAGVNDDA